MAVTQQDNEQNRLIAEHTIRIEYLEKNMSTLSQVTAELTMNTTAQTVQIQQLKEASVNTLEAVTKQANAISTLAEAGAWLKRLVWGIIIAALTVGGYIIQNAIKG